GVAPTTVSTGAVALGPRGASVHDCASTRPSAANEAESVCLTPPAIVKNRAASRVQRVVSRPSYVSGRSTNPLGTFGTKYVDLGGMTSPASATANTSSTLVGLRRTAAAALPVRTASNAACGSGV